MAKTLQEVLNTDLSPEKVKEMSNTELFSFLVKNDIVESDADVRMLIVEGIQKALKEDDEFPIRYYAKDEEMSEKGRITDAGECLTDDYIENNMTP